MQSVIYEEEGPIVQVHVRLYDLAPEMEIVPLSRGMIAQKILEERPFEAECFLNPTHEYDRELLEALSSSDFIRVEYFLDSPTMPYQGAKNYPNPSTMQQEAKKILARTIDMFSSEDVFAKARTRFIEENPWFNKK